MLPTLPRRLLTCCLDHVQADSPRALGRFLRDHGITQPAQMTLPDGRCSPLLNLAIRHRASRVVAWLCRHGANPWDRDTRGYHAVQLAPTHCPRQFSVLLRAPGSKPEYIDWTSLLYDMATQGSPRQIQQVWEAGEPAWRGHVQHEAHVRQTLWHQVFKALPRQASRLNAITGLLAPLTRADRDVLVGVTFMWESPVAFRHVLRHWPEAPRISQIPISWSTHAYGHPLMMDRLAPAWRRHWGQRSLRYVLANTLALAADMGWSLDGVIPSVRRQARLPWTNLSAQAGQTWPNVLLWSARSCSPSLREMKAGWKQLMAAGDNPLAISATGQNLLHALLGRRVGRDHLPLLKWAHRQGVDWLHQDATGVTPLMLLREQYPEYAARLEWRYLSREVPPATTPVLPTRVRL